MVAGVAADARAVRLPRRAAGFSLMTAAPQRLASLALLGIRKRA